MKRKAILGLAVTALIGIAAPALAGPKSAPGGRAPTTTTTTITNGGRHFK